jgi:leader peptidase (prepilin peptidase)/N-methyltransferase
MLNEYLTLYPAAAYTLLALFSLAIGSLLNVFIHRLPIMLQAEWSCQCRELLGLPEEKAPAINLFFPRSFCPSCKISIPFWHNIPLLSYLLLRGRCKQCSATIPFFYPLVELLCMLLSLLAAWHFGFNLTLIFVLIFLWVLLVLCFIDLHHQLLPDHLTLSLLWIGLIANTQSLFTSLPNAVLSAAGAYLSLWFFIKLFYLFTGKIGMGNGDFKLFAAFGAWFGWTQLPLILLFSSITGATAGMIYLKSAKKTRETPIPFGPFLCLAGLLSLFYGDELLRWYLHLYI